MTFIFSHISLGDVFFSTLTLVAYGTFISASEYLFLYNKRQYTDGGVFSWKIVSLLRNGYKKIPSMLRTCLIYGVLPALIIQIIFVLILVYALFLKFHNLISLSLGIILITNLFLNYRHLVGGEGSDQMRSILLVSLFIFSISSNELIKELCIFFIAAEATLAYFASGFSKLSSEVWRNKPAIFLITSTEVFGRKFISKFLLQHKWISFLLAYILMFLFITFPVSLFFFPLSIFYLIPLGLFHIMIAIIMRLNAFPWFFIATYPSIIYTSILLTNLVFK